MNPIKRIALLLIIIFAVSLPTVAAEVTLTPTGNAEDIIGITSFADSDSITNSAYAENLVALGIMYHSTGGKFLPQEGLSNALALRLVFKSIDKEAEAAELGRNHAKRLAAGLGEYDDLSWADGYYLLALEKGLLNPAEFSDAYFNPGSPLARDENVSAQNFLRWLTLAHNIILSSYPIPSDVYIDDVYRIYYESLHKYGIFSADDVRYFAPYRQITRDDIVLILGKFEDYILSRLKMHSATGSVTGINIKFSGRSYVRTINCYASGLYFNLVFSGDDIYSPFADISGETVVFGKGQPDISGILRKGDKVKLYYKDDKILSVRVTDYQAKEEYAPSPFNFNGTLYFYDPFSRRLAVNSQETGLNVFFVSDDLKVYRRTSEIDKTDLSENATDKPVFFYCASDIPGGLCRVYSVITN